jgi:hypothetical protein
MRDGLDDDGVRMMKVPLIIRAFLPMKSLDVNNPK